jgi:LemA protein
MMILANGMLIFGAVVLGVVLIFGIWLIMTYNRFVSIRQHLKESWSDVDVELKRRYDLIPNLISTVKGYADHEKSLFMEVTEARNKAMKNNGNPESQSGDEQKLVRGVGRLLAVAEQYPDLKASANFLELQDELSNTEDRIAAGRRFYNANVREMNQLCTTFPNNLVGGMFGFKSEGFFEVGNAGEREVPKALMD